jgi:cysteine synthase A
MVSCIPIPSSWSYQWEHRQWLSFTASTRGYAFTIVKPESVSLERKLLMRALGAEVLLTPASGGMAAAVEKAESLRFR